MRLTELTAHGVELYACEWHADRDGLTDGLEAAGAEVKHVGEDVTRYLKEGWKVLTFKTDLWPSLFLVMSR